MCESIQEQCSDMEKNKVRILFFIGSLCSGGKERRLIELLAYLKEKRYYQMLLVMTRDEVHYSDYYKLDIPYVVIRKQFKKNDMSVFFKLYRICKAFKPHILHTWGRIQSFYAIPSVIGHKIPLINSQITAAPPKLNALSVFNAIDHINFYFSRYILPNSKAGIRSYNAPLKKTRVIYNGINLKRLDNLPAMETVKKKYGIQTPYLVVMVASFTRNKDYNLFYEVAELVTKSRTDITFIGVGGYLDNDSMYKELVEKSKYNPRILFPGRIADVEALVNACTIGVLFSNKQCHGEGISNAIMEYMALSKPVIANDAGGTREILFNNRNGYLIRDEDTATIGKMILELIDDENKRTIFGANSRAVIDSHFTIDRMGDAFEKVYRNAIRKTV